MKSKMFVFFVLCCCRVLAQQTPVTVTDSILKTLQPGHPRLLANAATFASLKSRVATDATLKAWHEDIVKEGDKILTEPVSTYVIPDGKRLLATSRRVVDRMYVLGLLYQLDGDKKYADRAWQELEAASKFQDWNPSHFLDVGEMTHAFAIGYDWFYNYWTKQQKAVIRSAIIEKGLSRAVLAYQGLEDAWWTKIHHNWNQVCNGGIGSGALAIAEDEPKLATYVLQQVVSNLPYAMKSFGPDGAWDEGPGYWNYAIRYNIMILAALESSLGTDFGLGAINGFSKTAMFPVYLTGPLDKSFNYADGGDGAAGGAQLFWLSQKYNFPYAAFYQKQLVDKPDPSSILFATAKNRKAQPLDLLWYPAGLLAEKKVTPPLAAYFKHAEVVTMRSAWNDPLAWFVGFKAGDNKANHSNLDLGSFILDALGKRWIIDLGAENYNIPNYFQTGAHGMRWTYYRMRAEGHNTLVLNPNLKPDQNPLAATTITKFDANNKTAFAVADLSEAYATEASSIKRGVALVNGNSVVIEDEITVQKPADVYWFLHTPAKIAVQQDGRKALLTIDDKKMEISIIAPKDAQFTVMPAVPLPSSPNPAGINKNEGIQKLCIHKNIQSGERIVVEIKEAGKKGKDQNFYQPLAAWHN